MPWGFILTRVPEGGEEKIVVRGSFDSRAAAEEAASRAFGRYVRRHPQALGNLDAHIYPFTGRRDPHEDLASLAAGVALQPFAPTLDPRNVPVPPGWDIADGPPTQAQSRAAHAALGSLPDE